MRNYFDQEFKTKFSKQTMAKQNDFQWVIEEMETEFEYPEDDIKMVDNFFSMLARYNKHVNYFIRIYEIDKRDLKIENNFVKILSDIAKFALKEKTINKVLKDNRYKNFTVMYLLGLVACFIEKTKVNGSYDFGMFIYYNWFELYKIKNMSIKNKKNIEKLINELEIDEKKKIIDIYSKNYGEIKVSYKETNLKSLKKHEKLFDDWKLNRNQFCTWQEDYILQMSKLHFSLSNIIPQFSSRTWKVPNYDLWNEELLKNMKDFFKNNNDALTVLEIIDYRLNNININLATEKIVFDQVMKRIKNRNRRNDYENIWFYILIKKMKDKKNFLKDNLNQVYIELKKKRNVGIILLLKENGFIIDKELQKKIDMYNIRRVKKIEQIENMHVFIELLKDKYIRENINTDIIYNIMKIFYKLITKNKKNMEISSCFYHIINFLISIKSDNNSEIVTQYLFNILKLWNEEYYENMKSLLNKIEYKTTIRKEEIEIYDQIFIKNPLYFLRKKFSWEEQNILRDMTMASQFAISALARENTIYIDDFVPYMKKIDISQKNSLEILVCKYLDNLQIKYAEQLLNSNMEPIMYLRSLYERYSFELSSFINMISENSYKKMYEDIENGFLRYSLLPYSEEIKVAHITQLVPLVELLIRELGIKNNVIPFKEKEHQIHVMKDSSTILLNIIRKKYKGNNNFENIEIYLYLYNYLYNSNSLNIRNELIHAREYLDDDGRMKFAFRVLIIGIFWGLIELYIEDE